MAFGADPGTCGLLTAKLLQILGNIGLEKEKSKALHRCRLKLYRQFLSNPLHMLYASDHGEAIEKIHHDFKTVTERSITLMPGFWVGIVTAASYFAYLAVRNPLVAAMVGYFSVFNDLISKADSVISKVPIIKDPEVRMRLFYEDAEALDGKPIDAVCSVETEDLSFSYGQKTVFEKISFIIPLGIKTAVSGPDGSEKSTLIKLLCGLLKNYGGSLRINGTALRDVAADHISA